MEFLEKPAKVVQQVSCNNLCKCVQYTHTLTEISFFLRMNMYLRMSLPMGMDYLRRGKMNPRLQALVHTSMNGSLTSVDRFKIDHLTP
jgi:hypothetical protein